MRCIYEIMLVISLQVYLLRNVACIGYIKGFYFYFFGGGLHRNLTELNGIAY